MTTQEQQKIVDVVMHRMALRHGSSQRRDFEVACLTLDVLLAGNQAATSGIASPAASPALKNSTDSRATPQESQARCSHCQNVSPVLLCRFCLSDQVAEQAQEIEERFATLLSTELDHYAQKIAKRVLRKALQSQASGT